MPWIGQRLENLLRLSLQVQRESLEVQAEILDELSKIRELLTPPVVPDPGELRLVITGEGENEMLQYKISLPVYDPSLPNAADTDHGKFVLTTPAGEQAPVETARDQLEIIDPAYEGAAGDLIKGSFRWVDDDGNESVNESTFEIVLSDTIPPPDAAALGIVVTGET